MGPKHLLPLFLAALALAALAPAACARDLDTLIAPEWACPGQSDPEAGGAAQEEATGYMRASCFRASENLAWGTASRAAVRSIFRAWLESPPHRANILGGFDDLGVGPLLRALRGPRLDDAFRQPLRKAVRDVTLSS